jgi:hypothetical protein
MTASIEDMRIDHRRAYVLMPKELLDRPNIVPVLKQMSGKRMTEGVTTGWFGDPGFPNGFFDRPLRDGFVEVMTTLVSRQRIKVMA